MVEEEIMKKEHKESEKKYRNVKSASLKEEKLVEQLELFGKVSENVILIIKLISYICILYGISTFFWFYIEKSYSPIDNFSSFSVLLIFLPSAYLILFFLFSGVFGLEIFQIILVKLGLNPQIARLILLSFCLSILIYIFWNSHSINVHFKQILIFLIFLIVIFYLLQSVKALSTTTFILSSIFSFSIVYYFYSINVISKPTSIFLLISSIFFKYLIYFNKDRFTEKEFKNNLIIISLISMVLVIFLSFFDNKFLMKIFKFGNVPVEIQLKNQCSVYNQTIIEGCLVSRFGDEVAIIPYDNSTNKYSTKNQNCPLLVIPKAHILNLKFTNNETVCN